jgi:hypothetical protein
METAMRDKPFWRSRWWMPLFALALGGAMFGAYAIGGDPGEGVFAFGVMAVLAAVFLFGGRSETLSGLGGPGRDERWEAIDLKASAFAGLVLITTVIGAFIYEIADGQDGRPYSALGAIAGVAYIVGVAIQRWRS